MIRNILCIAIVTLLACAVSAPSARAAQEPGRPASGSTTGEPSPSLADAAPLNSAPAVEEVAKLIYETLDAHQDLQPYLAGVMTAFDVPPLGPEDVALADTRYRQGLPLFFKPQIVAMSDAFNDGRYLTLDSFIVAANARGAQQRGTGNPLTREYLTQQFARYAGQSQYDEEQVLPAFILALGRERTKHLPATRPDELWGDGLLDPLQATLLLYGVSFSGSDSALGPLSMASGVRDLNIIRSLSEDAQPASLSASVSDLDPISFIGKKIRGKVVKGIGHEIGIPLNRKEAAQVSVCASILLYGHKMTVGLAPNEIYHKDGVKPASTEVKVLLEFKDDYWSNYLPIDRWMIQTLFKCELPHRETAAGVTLEWSVSDRLIGHGDFVTADRETNYNGVATAGWQTVPETTPESQRTFYNQRDATGAIIIRTTNLIPDWPKLEWIVNQLKDTGAVGSAALTVLYYDLPSYRVDQIVADGRGHLTGTVCRLDQPFTLKIEGRNAAGGYYLGDFVFTPANASSGSWTHSAKPTCIDSMGCGTVSANGTFQTESGRDGRVIVTMHDTVQTSAMPAGGGTSLMPGWQFEMVADREACSKK